MTLTQKFIKTEGVSTLLSEAKSRYDWCGAGDDGDITVHFRSSIIRYGTYSTLTNEASFVVNFGLADILSPDGSKCWPLCDDFSCLERPEDVEKLATLLVSDKDAKKAFYRGRYHRNGCTTSGSLANYEFIIDNEYPTHVLFVCDKWLGCVGNLYNCDVIITKKFYALPIPLRTYRYLTR